MKHDQFWSIELNFYFVTAVSVLCRRARRYRLSNLSPQIPSVSSFFLNAFPFSEKCGSKFRLSSLSCCRTSIYDWFLFLHWNWLLFFQTCSIYEYSWCCECKFSMDSCCIEFEHKQLAIIACHRVRLSVSAKSENKKLCIYLHKLICPIILLSLYPPSMLNRTYVLFPFTFQWAQKIRKKNVLHSFEIVWCWMHLIYSGVRWKEAALSEKN